MMHRIYPTDPQMGDKWVSNSPAGGPVSLSMLVRRTFDDGFRGGEIASRMLLVSPEMFTFRASCRSAEDQEPHSDATYNDPVRTRIRVVPYSRDRRRCRL